MSQDSEPDTSGPSGIPNQPMAQAMFWVQHIFTFVGLIVFPSFVGQSLDQWLEISQAPRLFLTIGSLFGIAAGFWYLIQVTSPQSASGSQSRSTPSTQEKDSVD